jgi:hypothetical protein
MRVLVLTAALLALAVAFPAALLSGTDAVSVEYIGGTLDSLSHKADGHIRTTNPDFLLFDAGKLRMNVPYDKINMLEYGQKVDRRYMMAFLVSPMFLFSKSRQHFLTVGYTDSDGRQQAMVFRVGKGDIRSTLVSLEARTGLKIQYQDGEARKAGKG